MSNVNLNNLSESEKMNLAFTTKNPKILSQLASDMNSDIRKSARGNKSISNDTLEVFLCESVLNISFLASKNPILNATKNFMDLNHPCITCESDKKTRVCLNCQLLKNYYNKN